MQGLLPLLKSVQKPCSLKKFAGQTIGVDAYGWLHRGTAACAIELAQDKPTTKYETKPPADPRVSLNTIDSLILL